MDSGDGWRHLKWKTIPCKHRCLVIHLYSLQVFARHATPVLHRQFCHISGSQSRVSRQLMLFYQFLSPAHDPQTSLFSALSSFSWLWPQKPDIPSSVLNNLATTPSFFPFLLAYWYLIFLKLYSCWLIMLFILYLESYNSLNTVNTLSFQG